MTSWDPPDRPFDGDAGAGARGQGEDGRGAAALPRQLLNYKDAAAIVTLTLAERYRILRVRVTTCECRTSGVTSPSSPSATRARAGGSWWHDGDRGDVRGGRQSAHPRTLTSISWPRLSLRYT